MTCEPVRGEPQACAAGAEAEIVGPNIGPKLKNTGRYLLAFDVLKIARGYLASNKVVAVAGINDLWSTI